MSTSKDVTLDDKYVCQSGRVYLSGIQALVRLLLLQRRRDKAAGLSTGGFVSGYRGSPLGGVDRELWQAMRFLEAENIHFQPGLNEDLAATAIWGSQQVNLYPGAKVDGVFGLWYGKGPGVDRSMDALKHANAAGTSAHGGVLLVMGDDHGAESSTVAHQSEQVMAAAMIPVLNPATVQEFLDFGLLGYALSRFSGCWVGLKAISETVQSSAVVDADINRVRISIPQDFAPPPDGLHIRLPDWAPLQEARLHGPKMAAVKAFARANEIDRRVIDAPRPRLGILTAGKAFLDVRDALSALGLTEGKACELGIRLHKLGLTWPIEPDGARKFAEGLGTILVVEEKRGVIEEQLATLLYNTEGPSRARIVGKADETGRPLLPSAGELNATMVARAIVGRLQALGIESADVTERLARLEQLDQGLGYTSPGTRRLPFFCSGCPHNTSTKIPEGSRAMAGIGCHIMALWMPSRNTSTHTQMGGEGATWIGQTPFSGDKHVFQNLGDGTYAHSGLLAIRAAVAARVNITYKILYNDAVAMTGGQSVEGGFSVPQIAHQLAAEGVARIVAVSDDIAKYDRTRFPGGTDIRPREELDAVQRELRECPGVTILIYDQTCAAEKRRRRKRKQFPDPPLRVFINEDVCEGCGDCSAASNCISIKPLETELGRKRAIDQSNCNKDYSCLQGFCPSFVTVQGGSIRSHSRDIGEHHFAGLPSPVIRPPSSTYSILITGVGGTGVLTVSALLGMAAHLDGLGCTVLDNTGGAQKNGAVTSHVRLAPTTNDISAVRIGAGGADLLLGCDMIVAVEPTTLSKLRKSATRAVVNSRLQATADFVMNTDIDFHPAEMRNALIAAVGEDNVDFLDATGLTSALLGDSLATNLFMMGYAFQKGLIPLSLDAIQGAIALNKVAVDANLRTFALGRLAAHDQAAVADLAGRPSEAVASKSLPELIEHRAALLASYQDGRYAQRFRDLVARAREAETACGAHATAFSEAVARNYHRVLAYKDEYEVARLYTSGEFRERLRQQFDGDFKLSLHLAPPILAPRDKTTGHLRKRKYGPWIFPLLRLLARARILRGTRLDIFGYTAERRMERQLIVEYESSMSQVIAALKPDNYHIAVQLARIPEEIRGFGHVKEASVTAAKRREAELRASLNTAPLRPSESRDGGANAAPAPDARSARKTVDPVH